MSADWFEEDMRGTTLGHALDRGRGGTVHIQRYTVGGPAAVSVNDVCSSRMGILRALDYTSLELDLNDEAACRAALGQHVAHRQAMTRGMTPTCRRCIERGQDATWQSEEER